MLSFFLVKPVLNQLMCSVHRYHGSQRYEGVNQRLACFFVIQYPNKNVALVASDILHLLISYVDHLQKFPPETPKKIVEVRHAVSHSVHPICGHNRKMAASQRNHRYHAVSLHRVVLQNFFEFLLVFL